MEQRRNYDLLSCLKAIGSTDIAKGFIWLYQKGSEIFFYLTA